MDNSSFEAQYDLVKKSKIKKFYEEKKFLIISLAVVLIIFISTIILYSINKENKKTLLAENYILAQIYLQNGEKNKATDVLKSVIFSNDSTYSPLSLFLILNTNLITEEKELSNLFNQVLNNNKFDKELRNLIIFKKALYQSNFIDESELLKDLKTLINSESVWKPHALLLIGDYYISKKQNLKAKEFYMQILSLKNLPKEFYEQARIQLMFISND